MQKIIRALRRRGYKVKPFWTPRGHRYMVESPTSPRTFFNPPQRVRHTATAAEKKAVLDSVFTETV